MWEGRPIAGNLKLDGAIAYVRLVLDIGDRQLPDVLPDSEERRDLLTKLSGIAVRAFGSDDVLVREVRVEPRDVIVVVVRTADPVELGSGKLLVALRVMRDAVDGPASTYLRKILGGPGSPAPNVAVVETRVELASGPLEAASEDEGAHAKKKLTRGELAIVLGPAALSALVLVIVLIALF